MKRILSFITACMILSFANAQSIEHSLVSGLGGNSLDNQMDWSVGEVLIGGNETLAQGFHQGESIITIVEDFGSRIDYHIFPNPVQAILNIDHSDSKTVKIELYTEQGHFVGSYNKAIFPTQLDLSHLHDGAYYMQILGENKEASFYRILKISK